MRPSHTPLIAASFALFVSCVETVTPQTNPTIGARASKTRFSSDFALIPAGTFVMGDPSSQEFAAKPAHQVTISKSFLMQRTPVTVGQFKNFVKETGYRTEAEKQGGAYIWIGYWLKKRDANWRNPNFSQTDQHPVVCVTWHDAQQFIAWLNKKEPDMGYRLPTEAEWEYACRAGSTGPLYGDLNAIAWYEDNSGMQTHPVARKQPNAFGLYDMNGNTNQWCQDWFDENYYQYSQAIDPQGPDKSIYNFHTLRGGSWFTYHTDCNSHHRNQPTPDDKYSHYGFRLVCNAPQPN